MSNDCVLDIDDMICVVLRIIYHLHVNTCLRRRYETAVTVLREITNAYDHGLHWFDLCWQQQHNPNIIESTCLGNNTALK